MEFGLSKDSFGAWNIGVALSERGRGWLLTIWTGCNSRCAGSSRRLARERLGPGEQTPVHTHASSAALYVMSWSNFLRRDHEGNVVGRFAQLGARATAVGKALWLPPLPAHSVKNIGNAELRLIDIELK